MGTFPNSDMFSLREIHPALIGRIIASLREPMASGLARLQADLEGACLAVFDHVTDFDYDGVLTKIGQITGFRDLDAAKRHACERSAALVSARMADPNWKLQDVPAREANVLPATGT